MARLAGKVLTLTGICFALVNGPVGSQFEVTSIKPSTRCERGGSSPGMLSMCGTLASFIKTAYVTFSNGQRHSWELLPIEGGPFWINSDLYQINAKAEGTPGLGMMSGPMLQALLEDRFKLKTHITTREVSAYELTVSRRGPKLQEFKDGSCINLDPIKPAFPTNADQKVCGLDFARMEVRGGRNIMRELHAVSPEQFSRFLGSILARPVIDKTGLTGLFDIYLEYSADETTPGFTVTGAATGDPAYASIFTSLEQQLGLKLESTRGLGQFLVVDNAERPRPN